MEALARPCPPDAELNQQSVTTGAAHAGTGSHARARRNDEASHLVRMASLTHVLSPCPSLSSSFLAPRRFVLFVCRKS